MTTPITFTATVERSGGTTTGIEVPEAAVAALGGGKRPAVTVTINGASFGTTLGSMGGRVMIPLSAERRALTGTAGGDQVDVTIALDAAPKEIVVPDDLTAALEANGLRARFDSLAPSHRKEHVRAIEEAKAAETRARRIDKAIEKLRAD
jgi:hypothetical protein